MTLQSKAVLIKVDFSIPSGRKVDKDISNKVADDYNVSGGRRSSGNFNKIAISQKYFKPFIDIKRHVDNTLKRNTLPYLHEHDDTYLLPTTRIIEVSNVIREAEKKWNSEKSELVNSKYDEAMEEAKQRLNETGGMFKASDYPSVSEFVNKFRMSKFIRPVPDVNHGLELLTNVSEIESERIKKEVKQSMEESMEASKSCLYDKIRAEMHELHDILSKDSPRIRKTRIDGLTQTIRMIRELNFTNDPVLENARNYMVDNLILNEHTLRASTVAQADAMSAALDVLQILDGKTVSNTNDPDLMDKIYGY